MYNYIYTNQSVVLIITAEDRQHADDILESVVFDKYCWKFSHIDGEDDFELF